MPVAPSHPRCAQLLLRVDLALADVQGQLHAYLDISAVQQALPLMFENARHAAYAQKPETT